MDIPRAVCLVCGAITFNVMPFCSGCDARLPEPSMFMEAIGCIGLEFDSSCHRNPAEHMALVPVRIGTRVEQY